MAGGGVGFPACITGHMTSMGVGRWLPSMHYRLHDKWGGGSASGASCLQREGVCIQGSADRGGGLYPGGERSAYSGVGWSASRGSTGGSAYKGRGVYIQGVWADPLPSTGTGKAGGAHPTGMLPCD